MVVFVIGRCICILWLVKDKSSAQSISPYVNSVWLYRVKKEKRMSKRELIDCICEINKSARTEFLATFSEEDLQAYLEHLMELDLQELPVGTAG